MKKCYHSDCDQWNQSIATDDKYKFMTATAQSLVFSIAEMTMEDHANRHLFLPIFHYLVWGLRSHYVRPLGMGRFQSYLVGGLDPYVRTT